MSTWQPVCSVDEIPCRGARQLRTNRGPVALFRTSDGTIFALADHCPHKGGPLSQGIVADHTVTCPLHGWKIGLTDGQAVAPDKGCVATFPVKVERGMVWIQL